MFLGQIITERDELMEIQFKGAGKTPFSRTADGRKVLRSSIREFLCSEAMHHLNIPTTRSGSIITSDSMVIRDKFYTGDVINERSTIITRLAPTFLRFGSFEIFKLRDSITGREGPSAGNNVMLKQMLDYILLHHFPKCRKLDSPDFRQYLSMFEDIVKRTAQLVAKWQCVGFCHGVLNTDNMSIIGITIDYGPFGFMESFDPNYICNSSDNEGRYSYINQPSVCKWNLLKLSEAWSPFLPLSESEKVLNMYEHYFEEEYIRIMRNKLGLINLQEFDDKNLIESLFTTMAESRSDFTQTFRTLSEIKVESSDDSDILNKILTICDNAETLAKSLLPPVPVPQIKKVMQMMEHDPSIIYKLGIDSESLLALIEQTKKYEAATKITDSDLNEKNKNIWNEWLVKYKIRLLRDDAGGKVTNRKEVQDSFSPSFILRNYVCELIIADAEKGDYSKFREAIEITKQPFLNYEIDISEKSELVKYALSSRKYSKKECKVS